MSTTTQRWPSASDYSRAIQAPDAVFTDERLRRLTPVLGTLGVPMGASGQNAVVYRLSDGAGGRFAVRCYTTPASDARARYDALSQFVASHGGIGRIASATWIDAAMAIDGSKWPVVLMPWVEGAPLTAAVEDLVAEDPATLVALAERITHTVRDFQAKGMSHGDLQHGNILVTHDGAVNLVDLDGVWVPNMAVGAPGEFGHPNYQHPHRSPAHWGPNVDTFSAALIDVSLRAIAAEPGLVSFQAGENLVLVRLNLGIGTGVPSLFVDSPPTGPNSEYVRGLWEMSSMLPPSMRDVAVAQGFSVTASARGFACNADFRAVASFLNIGTSVGHLLR